MVNYSNIQISLLRKMYADRIIGGKHHGERELCRGFPKNMKSGIGKELCKLVKDGLVMVHPTKYGKQYSINPKSLDKIRKIIIYDF